ncbi:M15 family metallopeptidase [Streptomyces yaizuensis]|uniref:D-alanyl-D-alanine dipeptidase n=1 Tax=Streptomyces yaizuensis TaxID=2989713 RepID=A0ABQ5P6N5_9ACTN|nr:M15 family metallopeptidase [Streptomyces sp. YSPA8]GLF98253.1 M15 family metallopeptidase [Streptomyces sp. YSPA8]
MSEGGIVLMSDPQVAAVPVRECGEPLVDVRSASQLLIDQRRSDPAGAFAHLREGVAERLFAARRALPAGYQLLFVEGYRPLALQRTYFERYAGTLAAAQPEWSAERVREAASRFVSPPEIAPHSAGAAVDVTLADADGVELDMGTWVNANPEESEGLCYTDAEGLGEQARAHRGILGSALGLAGFVNYGTEFWHWSFGDRYWALATGTPAALYGPKEWSGVWPAGAERGRHAARVSTHFRFHV